MELRSDIRDRLQRGRHWTVLTGSGVSQESGVPTFREAQSGLWSQYEPEQLATPEAFLENPKMVWEWYQWRRQLCEHAQPNDGHRALAQLAECVEEFSLITQNVDGLHQRAGSAQVIEFHGNITRTRCSTCGVCPAQPRNNDVPPTCTDCGGLLRPDVVWFGEAIPAQALADAAAAVEAADIFVSAGTSSLVYPAAGLASEALGRGALVIEINPAPTPLSEHADLVIRRPAAQALPELAHWALQLSRTGQARVN